jgi:hypothetical protein
MRLPGMSYGSTGSGRPGTPGRVWVDLRAPRERAREMPKTTDWEDQFDLMVAYARREGWLDPSGKLVAAHISRRTSRAVPRPNSGIWPWNRLTSGSQPAKLAPGTKSSADEAPAVRRS